MPQDKPRNDNNNMSKKRKIRSYNLLRKFDNYLPGWGGMLVLLALFIAGGILGSLAGLLIAGFAPELLNYNIIIVYPIMFLPPLIYASVKSSTVPYSQRGISFIDRSHLSGKNLAIIALVASLATIAAAIIVEPVVSFLPQMPTWLEDTLQNLMQDSPLWVTLLSVSIFAPFFEELLCRGLVLRGLAHRTSPANAIIISSIFFALMHGNPWQAIPAFALGVLFGYVYYKTGSLKLPMLMHAVNNTFSVILTKMDKFKDLDYIYQGMSSVSYGVLILLMLGVLGGSLYYIYKLPPRTNASA